MHHSALLRVQGGIRHALLSNKCRLTTLACRGAVGGSAHLRLAAALASTAAAPLQRAQAAEVGAGAAPAGPAARTLAAGFATTGGRDSRVRTAGYRPALEFDPAVVSLHGETGLRTLCIDLPLADDAELQEEYASFLGHIRVGKLCVRRRSCHPEHPTGRAALVLGSHQRLVNAHKPRCVGCRAGWRIWTRLLARWRTITAGRSTRRSRS